MYFATWWSIFLNTNINLLLCTACLALRGECYYFKALCSFLISMVLICFIYPLCLKHWKIFPRDTAVELGTTSHGAFSMVHYYHLFSSTTSWCSRKNIAAGKFNANSAFGQTTQITPIFSVGSSNINTVETDIF